MHGRLQMDHTLHSSSVSAPSLSPSPTLAGTPLKRLLRSDMRFFGELLSPSSVRILRFKLHRLPTDTLKRRCSICCHGWTKATFTPQQKKTSRRSATSTWGTSCRLSSCSVLLSHLEEFWSCGASLMSAPAEMCFRGWSTAATWCVYYGSWPSPDADFLSDINICVFSSHNHMSDEAGRKTRSPPPGNRSWQMLFKLRNWRSGGLRTIRQVYGWQTYKFINKYVKGSE